MKLDHCLRKRQSEPGALMLGIIGRGSTIKRLHYQRDFLGPHADAGVADPNSQESVGNLTGDSNLAARGGELDRIAEKVDKYLFELDRITSQYGPSRWGSGYDHLDLGCFCRWAQHHKTLGEQGAGLGRDTLDLELPRFHLRKIEHFLDQGEQMHTALMDVVPGRREGRWARGSGGASFRRTQ